MEFEEFKKQVKSDIEKRDSISEELMKLGNDLDDMNVGLGSPLTDQAGFPLNHIDIPNIRTKRNRHACLRNDLKNLEEKIGRDLKTLHSMKKVDVPIHKKEENEKTNNKNNIEKNLEPFLLVDKVDRTSPSERAGLQVGDLILKFGNIQKRDVQDYGLNVLSKFINRNENNTVKIFVRRNNSENLVLKFVPRKWSGRGLLGCHIVPHKM